MRANPDKITRRFVVLSAAGALAACSLPDLKEVVGPPPAPQLYVLRPALGQMPQGAAVAWQLAVDEPEAPASLNTLRIALTPSANKLDYFANAAWPDRVPLLMQSLLLEAFGATRRISAARGTAGIAAEYLLHTELRDFSAVYENGIPQAAADSDEPAPSAPPPVVVVQIEAQLIHGPTRRVVGSFTAMTRAPAQANTLDSIVPAFNQATGEALTRIVDWVLRAPPPPPA
jgi:cholesterol transport system auxiliary component